MKINKVSNFIATTSLLMAFSCQLSAFEIDKNLFSKLDTSNGHTLIPLSLDRQKVQMFLGNKGVSIFSNEATKKFGENYTLIGEVNKSRACIVYTEEPVTESSKIIYDSSGKEFLVFDSDAYALHIAAHETTHCLNHGFTTSVQEISNLLNIKEMQPYGDQIRALDVAIRETHSDLLSALIGASQTGDWEIFTEVILPLRSTSYRPTHATTLAIYSMIKDINPTDLQKMSAVEVFELGNIIFSKSFYRDGIVSLDSDGVNKILQDWAASSHEQLYLATASNSKNLSTIRTVKSYLDFVNIQLGSDRSYDHHSANETYALKQIALEGQFKKINAYTHEFKNRSYASRLKGLVRSSSSMLAKLSTDNRHKMSGNGTQLKEAKINISKLLLEKNNRNKEFDYYLTSKVTHKELSQAAGNEMAIR